MKKQFQFTAFLLSIALILICSFEANSQCRVIRDSVIAGSTGADYSDYNYDNIGRLVSVIHRGGFNDYAVDVVLYDAGSGKIAKVNTYDPNDTARNRSVEFIIDAFNGTITRVNARGQDSTGVNEWAISHDVTYSGGNISSIMVDPSSVVGTPEGFPGSFTNMVWQNGNVTSLDLIFGTDTLKLTASYDNKNNVQAKLLNTEGAPGLFESENANNILEVTVVSGTFNGNPVAPGTKAVERQYTYTNGDVETVREVPSFFEPNDRTTKYFYDCTSGIMPVKEAVNIRIFPTPAADFVNIENGVFKGLVKIFDISGKEAGKTDFTEPGSSLDIRNLNPGVYYVEFADGQKTFRGKIVKN